MANIYVRSTDGSNTDNGTTWSLAKLDGQGAANIDAAGDSIWISHVHNETTSGSLISWQWAGTAANPVRIYCVNDGAQPPTTLATTGVVTTTGANQMSIAQGSFSCYGLTFNCATGTGAQSISCGGGGSGGHRQYWEQCNFKLIATGAGTISIGGATFVNCGFMFSAAAQNIGCTGGISTVRGGSILAGGTSPTAAFNMTAGRYLIEDFDFSQCSSSVNIATGLFVNNSFTAIFRNCKLPSSWGGVLFDVPTNLSPDSVIELINSSDGSQNYKYWKETRWGSVRDETTIVRTGGASDGITTLSWKMAVASTPPVFPNSWVQSPDIFVWNDTVGSSVTATVEIVDDITTLKNDEVWLEVEYLGSSSAPLATHVSTRKSNLAGTGSNVATSTATWTTTGLSLPVKQKLSTTFTPQMVGFVIARVCFVRSGATVYVDPTVTLT